MTQSHQPTARSQQEPASPAETQSDVGTALVKVYRPLHRAFMLTAAAYYGWVTIAHFLDESGFWLAVLASIAALTALSAIAVSRIVARHQVSVPGIELLTGVVQILMLANVVAYQLAHYEPLKLVYFPLLAVGFAMASISQRALVGSVVSALVAMLLIVAANGDPLAPYVFVSIAAGVTSIGLSTLLRGAIVREVAARMRSEAAEAEARHLAHVDFLTGLPNRRQFISLLDQVAAEQRPMAVGVLDLDGFKGVNDAFGHGAGDRALVEIARRLSDVIAPRGIVARIGGDEFAILVEGAWSERDLIEGAETLLREIRRPLRLETTIVNLGGSFGLAASVPGDTSRALLDRADYAAREAKQHHKGDVVVFSEAQAARVARERDIERELLRPDFSTGLEPVFQMIVDSDSGRPVGFETLARWHTAKLGNVPPSDFIPAAERLNLVPQITRAMVRSALAFAERLPRGVRVSVNLSPQDLASMDSMRQISRILDEARLRPCPIDFEITETAVVRDIGQATEALLLVMAHGCRVSLDDFGTGHSSLSRVQMLPLDRIKIDRSFVQNIDSSQTNRAIVKTTLDLCQNLGVSCVVEGVETEAQAQALRSLGARYFQGYLYNRPLPADAALAALSERRAVA